VTSNPTDFPLSIVSTDTTVLREISWTLSSFGYHVVTSSDWSEHAPWQRTNRPSLVLFDARDEQEIEFALSLPRATPYSYRIAVYDANSSADPDSLLDLGADDLVRYPVNIGEILTCLRRGARRLEFEKRLSLTTTFDLQAGTANRRGFVRQLERKLRCERGTGDGVLIALGIDFLPTIDAQYGFLAADDANSLLVTALDGELSGEDFRGRLQEGVFGVLLPGRTVSDGILFAESISQKINEQNSETNGRRPRLSISGVVLGWPSGDSSDDTVKRIVTALSHIRGFGGNLILDVLDVEQKYSDWKQQFNSRHQVDAQQIMEALPLVLPINATNPIHKNSLGIFALSSDRSLPPCVPIVDDSGHLLGVVPEEAFQLHGNDVFNSLEVHLEAISDTVKGNTRLDEIAKSLETAERGYLLVVENKKPIGYITNHALSAIKAESFDVLHDDKLTQADLGLSSLVVPLL
jgi:GGDEF domain-containing protein